ncbi:fumarylacetoacetate hydrolase family protein [Acuticoccus mangrovi]|uniref:Fumarylacetoacetate hydrolase family protein n=1 Tax=Acuticoccus mangrovi TaxID=2796142 RepID=A0A934MJF8_9HYPH|nr:fumarylacetoacetate hydrolase family protein [Acuticoccus mangrovi]MBJ3778256.1 fumarylacetoacetate hydrolase family protein [Acuticoccus mangrovi]
MKLVTFTRNGTLAIGALDGEEVIDFTALDVPRDMLGFIAAGEAALEAVKQGAGAAPRHPLASVTLIAPIPRPHRNIMCVGKNYHAHATEFAQSGFDASAAEDIPAHPVIFSKLPSTVSNPGDPIDVSLDPTGSVDYEGELAVVIGTGGRGITKADALGHVYGYTIVNDVTSRELQKKHRQWLIGKSLDGFCPMGPTLVTADEVPDPTALQLITDVNGERRQDAPVSDLIFDIPTLIETLSAGITLEAGDIIATGTAAGVGIGFTPPKYLKAGDRVAITIEPIGRLENPVVA